MAQSRVIGSIARCFARQPDGAPSLPFKHAVRTTDLGCPPHLFQTVFVCYFVIDVDPSLTILIIEDNENDIFILKSALRRAGINDPIQVVRDGEEAIHYLQGTNGFEDRSTHPFPKVIFTDIKMPRMSGFEVLHWLRSHPDCAVIPVIMLTASKMNEDVKKAYQMGANAYLVKPTSIDDLTEMVKTAYDFWRWCEKPVIPGNC